MATQNEMIIKNACAQQFIRTDEISNFLVSCVVAPSSFGPIKTRSKIVEQFSHTRKIPASFVNLKCLVFPRCTPVSFLYFLSFSSITGGCVSRAFHQLQLFYFPALFTDVVVSTGNELLLQVFIVS